MSEYFQEDAAKIAEGQSILRKHMPALQLCKVISLPSDRALWTGKAGKKPMQGTPPHQPGGRYAVHCGHAEHVTEKGYRGSGCFVVDLDSPAAIATFDSWGPLPDTLIVRTGKGLHVYFQAPKPPHQYRNDAGEIAQGIDIRTDGGVVFGPGIMHQSGQLYSVAKDAPLAPIPQWLHERYAAMLAAKAKAPKTESTEKNASHRGEGSSALSALGPYMAMHTGNARVDAYLSRAIEGIVSDLRNAAPGTRNDTLNTCAFRLAAGWRFFQGSEVQEKRLSAEAVSDFLFPIAIEVGQGEDEANATISSGARAGQGTAPTDVKLEAQTTMTNQVPPAAPQAQQVPAPPKLRTLGELLGPALERANRRAKKEEKPIPLPFANEQFGGGMWAGCHVIVGQTGTGKSALALQFALSAAERGIPVGYVGLELDALGIALRIMGDAANKKAPLVKVNWGDLYTGTAPTADLQISAMRTVAPSLAGLPFYPEFAKSHGWAASNIGALARAIREQETRDRAATSNPLKPEDPIMIVIDFLQLLGDEEEQSGRRTEIRERISKAAYEAREVARSCNAAVILLSSTARRGKEDTLTADSLKLQPDGRIGNPDPGIGTGKESGDIEFAADTVSVLVKTGIYEDKKPRPFVLATCKARAGAPKWSGLNFDYGYFAEAERKNILEAVAVAKQQEQQERRTRSTAPSEQAKGGADNGIPDHLR